MFSNMVKVNMLQVAALTLVISTIVWYMKVVADYYVFK